jgi:hypothetical protein
MKFTNIKAATFSFTLLMLSVVIHSCSDDDNTKDIVIIDSIEETEDLIDPEPEEPEMEVPDFTPLGVVEVFNEDKIDDNYILVNDASANRVYLMDKEARLIHEWTLTNNIGNDVFLLPNGKLLASLESDDPQINLGGKGGRLQIVNTDETIEWEFVYSSLEGETHHDVELLPNGNVITIVWERLDAEISSQAGFMLEEDIFPESIIEINPTTNEIVWEWRSMNHLVQDFDETKDNFGVISEHPELINLNYTTSINATADTKGDIMHANAIAYDEVNDVVLLSVNFFSEVWVIDHSTSTEEAKGSTGGNYNKGGDLIYRFGNPEAYENEEGNRLFRNNHFPNLLKGEDQGKLLIFSNGNGLDQSTVFELELPAEYALEANTNNEPRVTWSFTDPNLYSAKVSGAVPLSNGNILITEGDYGFWEVTREKEVVWKCNSQGFFWRGYNYSKTAPEILSLDL